MTPLVSVIIVSYNVSELLHKCLQTVFLQNIPVEVIVIDNASTDNTVQMISQNFSEVKLLQNKHNAGFSAANNQGMSLATGEYILLLNPDTEMKTGSLKAMLDYAEKWKADSVIGPQLLNSDGTLQVSAWKQPGLWNVIAESLYLHRIFQVSEYTREKFNTEFSPGMVSGAAMLFPKRIFEKIGGLDPELFWMEDADFCYRMEEEGVKIVYVPDAKVIHHGGKSSIRNLPITISNQLISKLKFLKKHHGGCSFAIAVFFCSMQIFSRTIAFGLLALINSNAALKFNAYRYTITKFHRYIFSGDKSLI